MSAEPWERQTYGYNPAFAKRVREKRLAAACAHIAAQEAILDAAAVSGEAMVAPELAAARTLREVFASGNVDTLFQDGLMLGRTRSVVLRVLHLQAALLFLIGRWAGEDGAYHGTPLMLARLARQSSASFIHACLKALADVDLLERREQSWLLTADGRALREMLSGGRGE